MFLIQDLLRSQGVFSEIFAEHIDPLLEGKVHPYTEYHPEPADVLLVHHSMGHDQSDWVLGLPVTKFLVYHNITPATYFPPDNPFHHYAKLGRRQLEHYRSAMQAAIAVSPYNARELKKVGYDKVTVIPLLLNIEKLLAVEPDPEIVRQKGEQLTLLFVGRISPNKCQHHLVRVLNSLRKTTMLPVRLVLVGSYDQDDGYYCRLRKEIRTLGLEEQVVLTGKVSDAALVAWYCTADIFLCLSEHEGFCVPLVEAMAFDLPILAYKSTNIAQTLGKSGLLLRDKSPEAIAALIHVVVQDRALRRALVSAQRRRLADYSLARIQKKLMTFFLEQGIEIASHPDKRKASHHPLKYQIEGPLETSYSLALVNRELAFALERRDPGRVGLFASEGPGDYLPDQAAMQRIPGLVTLWQRGKKCSRAEVVIRNMYPPRVQDMDGLVNLLSYAWEESAFPALWIEDFHRFLDGIACTSEYVKKVLRDNGYAGPIAVIGNGVSHFEEIRAEPCGEDLGEGFRFLHVSSCFPRKGVDVLLQAYLKTFQRHDQVVLIIKTFPNIHNRIEEQLSSLRERYPDAPPVILINRDLSAGQLKDLYARCQAFVAPSRGEGFGLPMAEAMWCGLPVITTAWGGQRDFCTPETSWLVDFSFQPAKSHLDLIDSVWLQPDREHLGRLMHEVRFAGRNARKQKVDAARNLLEKRYHWDHCARRLQRFERQIRAIKPLVRKKIRLGWVSSWNTRCGIATYSKFLLSALPDDLFELTIFASTKGELLEEDEPNVIRCWHSSLTPIDNLLQQLRKVTLDVLVVQFNFAFYSVEDFARLLQTARELDLVTLVIFHSTKDVEPPHIPASLRPIRDVLAKVDRLLVHGLEDLNRLKGWALVDNTVLFPHGVLKRKYVNSLRQKQSLGISAESLVVASYGFMLPHKGLEELLRAMAILLAKGFRLQLLMVNALFPYDLSMQTKTRCEQLVREYNLEQQVIMETDFLPDQQSLALLGAADLIVFPYQDTAESASGAVRYGLATGRPVACTPLPIFSDIQAIVHYLPGTTADDIARGIASLLEDPERLASKQVAQERWVKAHQWDVLARRLAGMIRGLVVDRDLVRA